MHVAILPFYDLVLFPHTTLPITLRDSVYIRLIHDCIRDKMPVAICLSESLDMDEHWEGQTIKTRKIAGIGIPKIVERSKNALKVNLRGVGKVSLDEIVQNDPYHIFESTQIHDKETQHPQKDIYTHPEELLNWWVNSKFSSSKDQIKILQRINTPEKMINTLATFLVKDREIKQILLEENDVTQRLELLNLLFPQASKQENPLAVHAIRNFELLSDDRLAQ